jgi:uncharacterized membrane protein YebE (DUF533 family)
MSADRILSQLLGSGATAGFAGGLASGLFTSKAGRKLGKKALQIGGVAAVGGIAYAAFQRYRQNQVVSSTMVPADAASQGLPSVDRFVPPAELGHEAEALGVVLLRAMVAAAQADGRLDGRERHAIYEHVGSLDLTETEKADLLARLKQPVDMSVLVGAAATPEIATEIYTASLLAIDVDTPAERAYLAMLAARLGLPSPLVHAIHQELGVEQSGLLACRAA